MKCSLGSCRFGNVILREGLESKQHWSIYMELQFFNVYDFLL